MIIFCGALTRFPDTAILGTTYFEVKITKLPVAFPPQSDILQTCRVILH